MRASLRLSEVWLIAVSHQSRAVAGTVASAALAVLPDARQWAQTRETNLCSAGGLGSQRH